MENDNFKDLLIQYGYDEIIDLVDMIAKYGIRNLSNDNTLDGVIESLDAYCSENKGNLSYVYSIFTSNYGANELLKNTISIYLLRDEFIKDRLSLDMINEYNRLYDQINEYKQILIDYENDISNKKTR